MSEGRPTERWQPPALFVVEPRGLVAMVVCIALLWALVGGETVTCEGTAARWECRRHSNALLLDAVRIAKDEASGPEGVFAIDVAARRGYAATVTYRDGDTFRLPRHPTREAAEDDRRAFAAWTGAPSGPLVLTGPPERRYLVTAWLITALTAAALAATAYVRLGRPRD